MRAAGAAALFLLSFGRLATAQADSLVVPTVVIYPGDTIVAEQVRVQASNGPAPRYAAKALEEVVGKVSRATLLPFEPIGYNALRAPQVFRMGATVRISYRGEGVFIQSSGLALQPGVVGERIRVKNVESSIVVSGIVQEDGSVSVSQP